MKKLSLLVLACFITVFTFGQGMTMEFNTNLSSGTTIGFSLSGIGSVHIDWGDGNTDAITISNKEVDMLTV